MDSLDKQWETDVDLSSRFSIEGERMSMELVESGNELIGLLRRYFRPIGNPPKTPSYLFDIDTASKIDRQGCTSEIGRFRDLLSDHRLAVEAIAEIPELKTVVESIQRVQTIMDSESAPRFAYLFKRFLDMPWTDYEEQSTSFDPLVLKKDPDKIPLARFTQSLIDKLSKPKLDRDGNSYYLGDGQEARGIAEKINELTRKDIVLVRCPTIENHESNIIVNGPFGASCCGYVESFIDNARINTESTSMRDSDRVRCIEILTDWVTICDCETKHDNPLQQSLQFGYTFAELDADFLWDLKTSLDEINPSEYSQPRSPQEWEAIFDCAWRTIKRGIKDRKIRALKISSKSYRIHLKDIPVSK